MAYTFLDITNKVIARMNEVPLTSSNFTSSRGFQTTCKVSVQDAISHINAREYAWPYNHSQGSETLVAGTTRYTAPTDSKYVDMDSFRLVKDSSLGTSGGKLRVMDYIDYLARGIDQEDDTSVEGGVPSYVFRTPDNNYGLYPYPDKAYTVKFDYFKTTTELSAATDVPAIPAQYEHVILDGATALCYKFRGEDALYERSWSQFQKGINNMQSLLLNHYEYAYSGMIANNRSSSGGYVSID